MSMNPARTFGSALSVIFGLALWIYFTAPVLAMQLAATLYLRGEARCIARSFTTTITSAASSIAAFPNWPSASCVAGSGDPGCECKHFRRVRPDTT